jgi:hypothetical protein
VIEIGDIYADLNPTIDATNNLLHITFPCDNDDVSFVLDQHAELDLYSAISCVDMSLHIS